MPQAGLAPSSLPGGRRPRLHRAWFVAAVTFVTIIGAAAFASLPGLLIDPLHEEFHWSRGTIGLAISVNLALYGLTAPFAAALMDRFGIRRVVAVALTVISVGSLLTVWMTTAWQLVLYWGVLVGMGSGSMALAFAATVTNRWFVAKRGWSPASSRRRAPRASWSSCRSSPGSSCTMAGAPRRSRWRSRRWPWCRWCGCCCVTIRRTWASRLTGQRSSYRSRPR